MAEVPRLILMLVLAGGVLTLLGAVAARFNDEAHRIRRGLKAVLRGEPHALIVARGRGRGAGFNFGTKTVAVTWDAGAWCLVYRTDELIGAELVLDGQIVARAHRGEARRALDLMGGAEKEVRLRLLFDDARHPDFDLVLWVAADEGRRAALRPDDAVQEANRWIARIEAVLRQPIARRDAGVPHTSAAAVAATATPAPEPPPWDDAPAAAPAAPKPAVVPDLFQDDEPAEAQAQDEADERFG